MEGTVHLQGTVMELGKPISTHDGDIVIDESVIEKAAKDNIPIPFYARDTDDTPVGTSKLRIVDKKVVADIEVTEDCNLDSLLKSNGFKIGPHLQANTDDIEEKDGVHHIKKAAFIGFSVLKNAKEE